MASSRDAIHGEPDGAGISNILHPRYGWFKKMPSPEEERRQQAREERLQELVAACVKIDSEIGRSHPANRKAKLNAEIDIDRKQKRERRKAAMTKSLEALMPDEEPFTPCKKLHDLVIFEEIDRVLKASTPREQQVLLARGFLGMTNPEISEALGITEETVEALTKRVFVKARGRS